MGKALKVVMARNAESFSFYYQENLDRWEREGSVTFFDPETDVPDLSDCDLLYLPGGYPEKHLEALVAMEPTRQCIRDYAERGGHIVAECGGMMYLCQSIVTDEGEYPMCGVLPYKITARQSDRKLSLGYRRFTLDGKEYRGHEFHYTQFLGATPQSVAQVFNAKGEPVPTTVFKHKNVLASYTHLYL
jgi:cobyrinic acid a,c-diamide synthase